MEWSLNVVNVKSMASTFTWDTFQTLYTQKKWLFLALEKWRKINWLCRSRTVRWHYAGTFAPRLNVEIGGQRRCHPVFVQLLGEMSVLGKRLKVNTGRRSNGDQVPVWWRSDFFLIGSFYKIGKNSSVGMIENVLLWKLVLNIIN